MLSKNQIRQINNSFKHSDCVVFTIGEKVYVAEKCYKHAKEGTIEMVECYEIDETCFEPNGEYYGETLSDMSTIILEDTYADNPNMVATVYYEDEVKEIIK